MLYNLGIQLFRLSIWILSFFNSKIKKGQVGRSLTFSILRNNISENDRIIWFHCASLGEYEQGLPVFKIIREQFKEYKIVLSFFSPSGYENKKNSDIADLIVYLPIDTPKNAKRFIKLLKPALSIFVKYDIWPNYLLNIERLNLKSILISARFRESQPYFKWYGNILKTALCSFHHIFVQDKLSLELLHSIGYTTATIAGDTRFDRVTSQLKSDIHLPWLEDFKGNQLLIIFGSTWPDDESFIINAINTLSLTNVKFLIAPHEINTSHIEDIKSKLTRSAIQFTDMMNKDLANFDVIILDTIGQLAKAYSYADIAYIGGAVGKTGLHNILEAAVFGLPIITGEHIDRFPEAIELKKRGGLYTISSQKSLLKLLESLIIDSQLRLENGEISKNFVKENTGAVIQIMDMIRI